MDTYAKACIWSLTYQISRCIGHNNCSKIDHMRSFDISDQKPHCLSVQKLSNDVIRMDHM